MTTNTVNAPRLRISLPMSIGLVVSVALGFLFVNIFQSASRSIGWIVFASVIALMLYPAVNFLDKFLPRGLAVFALIVFVAVLIVLPAYTVIDNVNRQTKKLEHTLPARAKELESKGKFSQSFKEFELQKKTKEALKRIPESLQGGTRQEQIKANADRAIAFVASGALMLFFLLYGHKLVDGALSVITEKKKHDEVKELLHRAYQKCTTFAWSQIALSIAAAITTYAVCRLASVPAAGLLAVWVALWNVVPVFGVVIGSLPIVVLAGAQNMKTAVFLLIFFILYEAGESFARHKLLGKRSLRLDSIITILVVFGGIELYGLGGALAGLVIASFLHALAGEFASRNPA